MGFRQAIITAKKIRTAVTGQRWEIDSNLQNRIRGYTGDPGEDFPGYLSVYMDPAEPAGGGLYTELAAPTGGGYFPPTMRMVTPLGPGGTYVRWVQASRYEFETPSGGRFTIQDDATPLPLIDIGDTWHNVGAGGGEPALTGTWVTNTAGPPATNDPRLQFIRNGAGDVIMRGRVRDPGAGGTTTIFTLPPGYLPTARFEFACKSNNDGGTVSWINVDTAGNVGVIGNVAQARVLLHLSLRFSVL